MTEDDKKSPIRVAVKLLVVITFFPLLVAKACLDVFMIGLGTFHHISLTCYYLSDYHLPLPFILRIIHITSLIASSLSSTIIHTTGYVMHSLPSLVDGFYQHILVPFGNFLYQTTCNIARIYHKYILLPACQAIKSIGQVIQTHILPPVYNAITYAATHTWLFITSLPSRLWKMVRKVWVGVVYCLQRANQSLVRPAWQIIHDNILLPTYHLLQSITSWFKQSIIDPAYTLVSKAYGWITSKMKEGVDSMCNLLNNIYRWLTSKVKEVVGSLSSLVSQTYQWITGKVKAVVNSMYNLVSQTYQWLTGKVKEVVGSIYNLVSQTYQWTISKVKEVVDAIYSLVSNTYQYITSTAKGVVDSVYRLIGGTVNSLLGSVKGGYYFVGEALDVSKELFMMFFEWMWGGNGSSGSSNTTSPTSITTCKSTFSYSYSSSSEEQARGKGEGSSRTNTNNSSWEQKQAEEAGGGGSDNRREEEQQQAAVATAGGGEGGAITSPTTVPPTPTPTPT